METILNPQLLLWSLGVSANLLPIGIGIWRWRHMTLPLRLILGSFGFSVLLAGLSVWCKVHAVSTDALFYLGPVVYMVLYGWAYTAVLASRPNQMYVWAGAALLTALIGLLYWWRGLEEVSAYGYAFQNVYVLVLGLSWLRRQMVEQPMVSLRTLPWFWINMGLLVYQIGCLLMLPFDVLVMGYEEQLFLWIFYVLSPFLQAVQILLVCVGLTRPQVVQSGPRQQIGRSVHA